MSFPARYRGHCPRCDESIATGEDVTYEGDDLVHADCDEHYERVLAVVICPACHLTKPCGCEDDR